MLIDLPDEIDLRFQRAVPPQQRNAFIADLIDKALLAQENDLYRTAMAVEEDERLNAEMNDWDVVANDEIQDSNKISAIDKFRTLRGAFRDDPNFDTAMQEIDKAWQSWQL